MEEKAQIFYLISNQYPTKQKLLKIADKSDIVMIVKTFQI